MPCWLRRWRLLWLFRSGASWEPADNGHRVSSSPRQQRRARLHVDAADLDDRSNGASPAGDSPTARRRRGRRLRAPLRGRRRPPVPLHVGPTQRLQPESLRRRHRHRWTADDGAVALGGEVSSPPPGMLEATSLDPNTLWEEHILFLKRTKMQGFDQQFSGADPRGPLLQLFPSQPVLSDAPVFSTLRPAATATGRAAFSWPC